MPQLDSQAKAQQYVDTTVRMSLGGQLGPARILPGEREVEGKIAWPYQIEGLPMPGNAHQRWVLETGELFETSVDESENTPEKALAKSRALNQPADTGAPTGNKRVSFRGVELLTPQEVFERNMSRDAFNEYVQTIADSVEAAMPAGHPPCELLVKVELTTAGQPKIDLSYQGEVEDAILDAIYRRLYEQTVAPTPTTDNLSFTVHVNVA